MASQREDTAEAPAIAGIVGVCFWMAVLAWGTVFYGYSFYLDVLVRLERFSTAEVSGAIAFGFWCGIPAGVAIGHALNTAPPFRVVAYGAMSVGTALIALPHVESLAWLYVVFALFGTGYPCLSTSGIAGTLNVYVKQRYASRLGIALTGASIGGAGIVPCMVYLESAVGFSMSSAAVGAIVITTVLLPAALRLRHAPGPTALDAGTRPRRSPARNMRSRAFVLIVLGCALALGAQVGFLAHQIPMLTGILSQAEAAFGVSVTAGIAIAGRFMTGWLAERMALHVLAALAAATQATGLLVLSFAGGWVDAYLACAIAGFVVGSIVMLPPLLVRARFGSDAYAQLYAYCNVGLYLGAGAGPLAVGLMRDATGDYFLATALLVALHGAAFISLMAVGSARTATQQTP